MRSAGTQTKHGAAVRMRRRLGLAPRAYVLLSCSLALVVAGVSAYGMTVPSMVQAHAARELHIGRKAKSDLGTTTGYAWASVVGRARTAVPVRVPPLAVDLRVAARRTAVPAATQARVASRLPRRRVSTVGS